MFFKIFQSARFEPVTPQPAGKREQVEMRITLIRNRNVVKFITGGEQRRVKGFAVEGHERVTRRQKICNAFEQGGLFRRVTHKELLQDKSILNEARHAHQKGI